MTWVTFRHEAMATYFEVAVADAEEPYARQAAAAAFREIDRLESELSRFVPSSDVARVNRLSRGESADVGEALLDCLLIAADVSLATNGRFDVAYGSSGRSPTQPLPFTLDPDRHRVTACAERLQVDLGAIGKGYALDVAAELLAEWGLTHACVVSGGSSVVVLDPPGSLTGWPIGIGDAPSIQHVPVRRVSVSASGTAVKGAHVIDPSTGRAAARTARVWALASSGAQSDALSTAFFVMPDAEIAAFCSRHPEIGAAWVEDGSGKLLAAGALATLLGR